MQERLLKLLKSLNLSATKLADEIKVQRSGISHILSGRNQPSYDFLVKFLTRFPEINAEWLIIGKGSMFNKTQSTSEPPPESILNNPDPDKDQDLFSQSDGQLSIDDAKNRPSYSKVTNVTYIKSIAILNSDGTFDIYQQAKKE